MTHGKIINKLNPNRIGYNNVLNAIHVSSGTVDNDASKYGSIQQLHTSCDIEHNINVGIKLSYQ